MTPLAFNHSPAGPFSWIEPAGEMWSVVIESPNTPSARARDAGGGSGGGHAEVLEERRLGDIGRGGPVVDLAFDGADLFPQLARGVLDVRVVVLEDLRVHRELHHGGHFFRGGPDVAEIDVAAFGVLADRFRH